jgi:hypothetical protein
MGGLTLFLIFLALFAYLRVFNVSIKSRSDGLTQAIINVRLKHNKLAVNYIIRLYSYNKLAVNYIIRLYSLIVRTIKPALFSSLKEECNLILTCFLPKNPVAIL